MIYNKLKLSINEKFINAKVKGTGDLAPRPGYYYIRSVSYKTVKPFGEICIADVNWKQDAENLFVEDLVFTIALSNLSSAKPEETANFKTEEDLLGRVIYIYNPQIIQKNFNGHEKPVVSCLWQLVNQSPEFLTVDNLLISALSNGKRSGDVTINEAYKNSEQNSLYDLASAEDNEAQFGNKQIVYIEDAAWLDTDIIEDPGSPNDPWDDNTEASDQPEDES